MEDARAVVSSWIAAFRARRDGELLQLAAEDLVIRPRPGRGSGIYEGRAGLRRYLADVAPFRGPFEVAEVTDVADGRVLVEYVVDGVTVASIFTVRDGQIAEIAVYLSDRELLERTGVIPESAPDLGAV
jgi:ketosteroid isomerase-like protein